MNDYIGVLRLAERKLPIRHSRRDQQFRILKAAALLVIYNAVEASARSAIEAIYDEIGSTGANVDDLLITIRSRVLHDFRSRPSAAVDMAAQSVAAEIVQASFDRERLFSGNVDARLIRKKAADFGFSANVNPITTRSGSTLVTVKEQRNDLAHGVKTFAEVGRYYSASQIEEMAHFSMAYMHEILSNISTYLDNADFIAT